MIEKFHQLNSSKLGVIAVHIVNLPPECLAQGVTAKVLHFQAVFPLNLFQDYVYSLNSEDCAFLTYQYGRVDSERLYLFVTFCYVLLQLRIQTERPFLTCLLFDYGKFLGMQYLLPPQGENVRNSQPCETAEGYKKRNFIVTIFS